MGNNVPVEALQGDGYGGNAGIFFPHAAVAQQQQQQAMMQQVLFGAVLKIMCSAVKIMCWAVCERRACISQERTGIYKIYFAL